MRFRFWIHGPSSRSPRSCTRAAAPSSATCGGVFCEQRRPGGLAVWQDPFTCLRVPKVFNLRMDSFERADVVSDQYNDWLVKNAYLTGIATMKATDFLQSFVAWPPSQKPASFTVDQVRKSVDEQIERHAKQGASRALRDSAPPH